MQICVVGCGAMGSIYAVLLSAAGHDVCVIDPNVQHIKTIKSEGLRVWGASGDHTEHVNAFLNPEEFNKSQQPPDLLICAVKAKFVPSGALTLKKLLGPNTRVLTIQNGLGSADIVANAVGANRLIIGTAQGFGASLPEPGCAHHNDMKAIRMGAYDGLDASDVAMVAKAWSNAGFDAKAVDNIASMQWGKLIFNVAYSAPCAVTGFTLGEVLNHPQMSIVSLAAAQEAYDVALKLGIDLNFQDVKLEITNFAKGMLNAKPSVLLDLEAGRESEVGVINGAVPLQAEKVGLQAPINAALTALVHAIEASTRS